MSELPGNVAKDSVDHPEPTRPSRAELIELLRDVTNEEHYFLSAFQREVAFFWGTISAIAGAVGFGLFNIEEPRHYYVLAIGPVLLLLACNFMRTGISRSYGRFLEAVSMRAKIERDLGFHLVSEPQSNGPSYWTDEPLLAPRHLNSRRSYGSSEEFIDAARGGGLFGVYARATLVVQVLSGATLAVLVFMGYTL